MAAPASTSLSNLRGKYQLNKALSTIELSSILAIQGVSLLTRKAISSASVHLTVHQPAKDQYTITQSVISQGIPGTSEQYHLDGEWRSNDDPFFGRVTGRSEWLGIEDAEKRLGAEDAKWDATCDEGRVVFAEGQEAGGKWGASRVWAFEEIDGERKWVQMVKVRNREGEEVSGRMVYDYLGEE